MKLVNSSSFQQSRSGIVPEPEEFNLGNQQEFITYLYRLLANSHQLETCTESINCFLQAGILRFNADVALLIRPISSRVAEVAAFVGGGESFYVGQHLSLEGTPCSTVFEKNETFVSANINASTINLSPVAYNGLRVGAYLGTSVHPHKAEPGVVCFLSARPRSEDYTVEDVTLLVLLAEGVACMTDQQRAQAQRKLTDQAMFALGSVKTLEEYLEQARLPEVFGVPARVVEVLERRVGHAPLSIGHVAEELNLSKRTLQRRLQQQDVNFAELRDQVRFHYSIDYLIKQHLSIDSISASLDFSDRTSFTNAFKRWTGLSPSTFRKLFRDYV